MAVCALEGLYIAVGEVAGHKREIAAAFQKALQGGVERALWWQIRWRHLQLQARLERLKSGQPARHQLRQDLRRAAFQAAADAHRATRPVGRQLRVQALSLRNRDYLLAAKARGESSRYVIFVELIPPMTSLIVANFLGAALYAVLAESGLQFVGLGNINEQSWGTMLYWAQNNEALQTGLPLWALSPGVAIAVLGSGLALLNYAFDEVANPALRPVRATKLREARP